MSAYDRPVRFPVAAVVVVAAALVSSVAAHAQDFVGTRNEAGRLPKVSTLDFTIARPLRFMKYQFSGGFKVYNAFNTGNERDVQNNIASPDFGKFYNPIQRSIGFYVGSSRP